MRALRIALTMLALGGSGIGQTWLYTLDGGLEESDHLGSVALDDSGCVYTTGTSIGDASRNNQAWTVKLGPDGGQRWFQVYDPHPGFSTGAGAIAVDGHGTSFVAGSSRDSSGMRGFETVCYSRDGTQLWARRYSEPDNYYHSPSDISVFPGGGCVVTGKVALESWDSDYCTMRYDSAGTRRWLRTYSSPGEKLDEPNAVVVDETGNSFVTGEATDHPPYGSAVTIKYDSLGNEVWVNRWEISGWNSTGQAIVLDSAGYIYVAGMAMNRMMAMKLDPQGDTIWTGQTYGGYATGLGVDGSGNVYIAGSMRYSHYLMDIVVAKFDSTGFREWEAIWRRDSIDDWLHGLALGPNGSIYICGSTRSHLYLGLALLVKYNPAGEVVWEDTLHGLESNTTCSFEDITVDHSGNIVLAGDFSRLAWNPDFFVAKYPPTGPGIAEQRQKLNQVGAPSTICRGTLKLPGRQATDLLDITGRRVVNLQPGPNDIRHIAPGIYFIRGPETEDGRPGTAVRKIVIRR